MSDHKNFVRMSVSGTPGTGTITLGSASSGFQSLASAYGANATVDVSITDGTAWEVARDCTYTNSGTTLTRGTLEASSTGSALSLTSAAIVNVTATADLGNRVERLMRGLTPGGRLTTESGIPVSTSDRTSQSTLYYTPFVHDQIILWDGTNWRPYTVTETSLALSGLTSGKPYDVFGYVSSGVLALELLAWTDDTTRATAVTLQDGRYCKSGDKTRLLLGTIYTTGTTTTADAEATRYVWNAYNQVNRRMAVSNTTSHSYTSGAWREWNAGSGVTRLQFIAGLQNSGITLTVEAAMGFAGTGVMGYINIDYDAANGTNRQVTNLEAYGVNSVVTGLAVLAPPIGKHYATVIQYGTASVTYSLYSLRGNIQC